MALEEVTGKLECGFLVHGLLERLGLKFQMLRPIPRPLETLEESPAVRAAHSLRRNPSALALNLSGNVSKGGGLRPARLEGTAC
jgi:hypothetical protein